MLVRNGEIQKKGERRELPEKPDSPVTIPAKISSIPFLIPFLIFPEDFTVYFKSFLVNVTFFLGPFKEFVKDFSSCACELFASPDLNHVVIKEVLNSGGGEMLRIENVTIIVSSSNLMGFQSQEKYNSCSIYPYHILE